MPAKESLAKLMFPANGIDLNAAFSKQRQGTTPSGVNVRTFEPSTNRARGAQRSGVSRYLNARVNGAKLVQEVGIIVSVTAATPMQTSGSGRVVNLVAVSGGAVFTAQPGATAWTAAINTTAKTPPLAISGVVRSAANIQKLWFADGANWCYYDPFDGRVHPWVATKGTLPGSNINDFPRLIVTWRGRTVVSGILHDPQNWFMSAVSDPTNWDFAPVDLTPTQAVVGNDSPLGLIGDCITTLIPYTDDVMIVGGDHTIWQIAGDPMSGGQIDLVTGAIGMAWGIPWCTSPDGTIYFVSNRTGIYTLIPGQAPQRISQAIEQLLLLKDTGANTVRLLWDDRFQGLHVFVSPTAAAGPAVHFFYEVRTGAWWTDVFGDNNLNPLCCCVFDGNTPGDRVPLIGSWDGFVRAVDPTATTDDGTIINSTVTLGPLLTPNSDAVQWKYIQVLLAAISGPVRYAVYVGPTAEIALSSAPVSTGIWTAGRNPNTLVRRKGHALWLQLTAAAPWAFEMARVTVASTGKVGMRGAR